MDKVRTDGREAGALVLATFDLVVREERRCAFPFLWRRRVAERDEPMCLVFFPWKHRMKELKVLPREDVISFAEKDGWVSADDFVSHFTLEAPYKTSFDIRRFRGYPFIYRENAFLANVMECCENEALEILYREMPQLLSLSEE